MPKYGFFQTLTEEQAERFLRGEPITDWTYDPEKYDPLAQLRETIAYLAEYQPPCGTNPQRAVEDKRASED